MTLSQGASARQPVRQIVSLTCDSSVRFCQELIQSLSEQNPGYIYRINLDRKPEGSFDLILELDSTGRGKLIWPNGAGQFTSRAGQSDAEFARRIVANAGPELTQALENP